MRAGCFLPIPLAGVPAIYCLHSSELLTLFKGNTMKNVQKAALGSTLAGGLLAAQSASAALSAEVGTGLTAIQTDALALVDLIWPVVVAVTVAFVMFKIFKRGVAKV